MMDVSTFLTISLSYNVCLVKKEEEKREGVPGLLEQHELLKNLPDASTFQEETHFHPIFDFDNTLSNCMELQMFACI